MVRPIIQKRNEKTRQRQRALRESAGEYLVGTRGKRAVVVLDLGEYKRLLAGTRRIDPAPMSENERSKLVKLARQAKGSWEESEGKGTAVQIVRRMRDEWNR